MTRLSIAIPVFNEEAVLPEFLSRLRAVLDHLSDGPHEIVIVDDGSTDSTAAVLDAAAAEDNRIRAVILSRNFGHQAALSAALDFTTGDAVVMMDGDLQDPPEAIGRFLDCHARGFDVVYARRVRRKEGVLLRSCYRIFYRLIAVLSDIQLPIDAGDFALVSRRALDAMKGLPEHHRYLRGLRTWVGFRQVGLDVERARRGGGKSKYSFGKLVRLGLDGVFAFSIVPLRLASLLGLAAVVASTAFAGYSTIVKLLHGWTPVGFTALLVVLTFVSGVQLLFLGIIGEYVGRIYEEAKGRPTYVVARVIGAV